MRQKTTNENLPCRKAPSQGRLDLITGITRVRNESLIIADTLEHFLGFCESIILYDDASTDDTADIAESFGVTVIRGKEWRTDRQAEETRHRALLLEQVRTPWVLCFDADERLDGALPELTGQGFTFRLFDGYMSPGRLQGYEGGRLCDLPRLWGPEYRDILMLFRKDRAFYNGPDQREPCLKGRAGLADVRVKHFGKCISEEQWDETCDYYSTHWPEPYRTKWAARKGKAIHTMSDYGMPLYRWRDVHAHAVRNVH